jgi:hypothetical protein
LASSIKLKTEELQNYLVKLVLSDEDRKQDYENLQNIPVISSASAIHLLLLLKFQM